MCAPRKDRASASVRHVTTWRGPSTEWAGLTSITWLLTSQSKRWRSAASRCYDRGRRKIARRRLDPRRDMHPLNGVDRRHAGTRTTLQKFFCSPSIGSSCVRIANVGGEEFEKTHG